MRKTIDEMIAVMQAYKDGKEIEQSVEKDCWHRVINPVWNWLDSEYRIAEEQYRAYKDTEEMIDDFNKRFVEDLGQKIVYSNLTLPSIWVKSKTFETKHLITEFGIDYVTFSGTDTNLKELFENYTYLDGSAIGVKE